MFAAKGAHLVLGARREEPLRELALECERMGVRALAVPVDTSDEQSVRMLAQRALEAFGRIDVWVNDASVYMLARFGEEPPEDFRRLFDINVLGYVHGARAALPIFRQQGRGTLINIASVDSLITQAYTSAYVMSKHAVRALGGCLRQELMLEGQEHIHVCTVMPSPIDTPIFERAANHTGRQVKAFPPVYPVERAAATIVRVAEEPRREVIVGGAGRLFALFYALAPAAAEAIMAVQADREHLYRDRPAPRSSGNLHRPMAVGTTPSGGWNVVGRRGPLDAADLTAYAISVGAALLAWRYFRQQRQAPGETAGAPRAHAVAG
jgi:short-subunit dehydrogenase